MFCTGGIRCEKASSFMLQNGFKNVFHLKGGIISYLEKLILIILNGKANVLFLIIELQLNKIYQLEIILCAMHVMSQYLLMR